MSLVTFEQETAEEDVKRMVAAEAGQGWLNKLEAARCGAKEEILAKLKSALGEGGEESELSRGGGGGGRARARGGIRRICGSRISNPTVDVSIETWHDTRLQ